MLTSIFNQIYHFRRSQKLRFTRHFLNTSVHIYTKLCFIRSSAFGSNQNNTICSANTINRSRRSIFQNLNTFDVVRIDVSYRTDVLRLTSAISVKVISVGNRRIAFANYRNAIDNIKRIRRTTNTYQKTRAWRTRRRRNIHARYFTLYRATNISNRLIFEIFVFHGSNRASYDAFFLRTVANYHRVLQLSHIVFHDNIHNSSAFYLYFLSTVADARKNKSGFFVRKVDCKSTVFVGCSVYDISFELDINSRNWFACVVLYCSCY